ncbi:hypothetical protein LSCM1_03055 [Leishmania martiniquensis]|uniref:Choline/carnitine acyltransferase domain-containing protein n=1 Tax=Leishmania martiniquensis TaxID=1580590 RepID=A0A836KKT5_9TRYP|nr:hypothetical protein LSCM1_03055 [Leishmania martiniquensis]
MASTAKKKVTLKERLGYDGVTGTTNVQSPFVSAAHNTVWPYDPAAHNRGEQTIFTAAANAIRGLSNGANGCDRVWVHVDSPTRSRTVDFELPASEEWKAERAMQARLQTTAASRRVRPSSASYDPTRARDTLYDEWLRHIVAHRASPLQYPYHVLHVTVPASVPCDFSDAATIPREAFLRVAAVVHQLLAEYLHRCNKQPGVAEEQAGERVPPRLYSSLLGNSVYNISFAEPPLEKKDETFDWVGPPDGGVGDPHPSGVAHDGVASVGAASADPVSAHMERMREHQPPAPARRYDAISLVSCADADHVNVCVGQHFYKLSVMDRRGGRLRGVTSLAADLEALHAHHLSLLHTDTLPGASPAAREDRKDLETMFANLSCLADEVAFDVRRRLRVSSEVNAYSLRTLEAGLCTLVLREDDTKSESESSGRFQASVAQWLHSVCSLETSLSHPEQWTVRLQALVSPLEAGMEWVRSALTQPSVTVAGERAAGDAVTVEAGGVLRVAADEDATARKVAVKTHELSTSVDASGAVEYLELWLPEKHRVPLRPYGAPVWSRADAQVPLPTVSSYACTLVDFCMNLLRVTAEWKREGRLPEDPAAAGGQPRIVVALQPPRGGAPSLIALGFPAVQHLYEVFASPPLLFADDARRRVEAEARAEVAALLNMSWHSTSTVRAPLNGASAEGSWFEEAVATAKGFGRHVDVCLSFAVLPLQAVPSLDVPTRVPVISRLFSDLAVPSSLLVNCTAQQTMAEAHVRASRSTLVDAVVGPNAQAVAPVVRDFAAALASCMRERRQRPL